MSVHIIDLKPVINHISDVDFENLCASNPELKLETDAAGKLIVMSPTGSESGRKNADLIYQLQAWNRRYKLGEVFDSSTGFKLSNSATRSPDVSWIAISRWNSLTDKQKRGFAPIDPDFVIELMSPTDDLLTAQQKMAEYMSCEIKLGWLINPDEKQVEIYRTKQDKEVLKHPTSLSGETLLPNLIVDLSDIL
ncbi:MAG: Uma2 family endonuclease [Xenococcaceae cyanobacterium MO_188.B19]|nr:Uma2 family endonuclease [Xenococcaceae cyanobacterium MO_188.B19]